MTNAGSHEISSSQQVSRADPFQSLYNRVNAQTHIKYSDIRVSVLLLQLCKAILPWSSGRYPRPVRAITHTSLLGLLSNTHNSCRLLTNVSVLVSLLLCWKYDQSFSCWLTLVITVCAYHTLYLHATGLQESSRCVGWLIAGKTM